MTTKEGEEDDIPYLTRARRRELLQTESDARKARDTKKVKEASDTRKVRKRRGDVSAELGTRELNPLVKNSHSNGTDTDVGRSQERSVTLESDTQQEATDSSDVSAGDHKSHRSIEIAQQEAPRSVSHSDKNREVPSPQGEVQSILNKRKNERERTSVRDTLKNEYERNSTHEKGALEAEVDISTIEMQWQREDALDAQREAEAEAEAIRMAELAELEECMGEEELELKSISQEVQELNESLFHRGAEIDRTRMAVGIQKEIPFEEQRRYREMVADWIDDTNLEVEMIEALELRAARYGDPDPKCRRGVDRWSDQAQIERMVSHIKRQIRKARRRADGLVGVDLQTFGKKCGAVVVRDDDYGYSIKQVENRVQGADFGVKREVRGYCKKRSDISGGRGHAQDEEPQPHSRNPGEKRGQEMETAHTRETKSTADNTRRSAWEVPLVSVERNTPGSEQEGIQHRAMGYVTRILQARQEREAQLRQLGSHGHVEQRVVSDFLQRELIAAKVSPPVLHSTGLKERHDHLMSWTDYADRVMRVLERHGYPDWQWVHLIRPLEATIGQKRETQSRFHAAMNHDLGKSATQPWNWTPQEQCDCVDFLLIRGKFADERCKYKLAEEAQRAQNVQMVVQSEDLTSMVEEYRIRLERILHRHPELNWRKEMKVKHLVKSIPFKELRAEFQHRVDWDARFQALSYEEVARLVRTRLVSWARDPTHLKMIRAVKTSQSGKPKRAATVAVSNSASTTGGPRTTKSGTNSPSKKLLRSDWIKLSSADQKRVWTSVCKPFSQCVVADCRKPYKECKYETCPCATDYEKNTPRQVYMRQRRYIRNAVLKQLHRPDWSLDLKFEPTKAEIARAQESAAEAREMLARARKGRKNTSSSSKTVPRSNAAQVETNSVVVRAEIADVPHKVRFDRGTDGIHALLSFAKFEELSSKTSNNAFIRFERWDTPGKIETPGGTIRQIGVMRADLTLFEIGRCHVPITTPQVEFAVTDSLLEEILIGRPVETYLGVSDPMYYIGERFASASTPVRLPPIPALSTESRALYARTFRALATEVGTTVSEEDVSCPAEVAVFCATDTEHPIRGMLDQYTKGVVVSSSLVTTWKLKCQHHGPERVYIPDGSTVNSELGHRGTAVEIGHVELPELLVSRETHRGVVRETLPRMNARVLEGSKDVIILGELVHDCLVDSADNDGITFTDADPEEGVTEAIREQLRAVQSLVDAKKLPAEVVSRFKVLLEKHQKVWRTTLNAEDGPVKIKPIKLRIKPQELLSDPPPPCRMPIRIAQRAEIQKHVEDLLKWGVIRRPHEGEQTVQHPVVIVKKPSLHEKVTLVTGERCSRTTKRHRICQSFDKWVNKNVTRDDYESVKQEDLQATLGGCKWFGTLDLLSGFWQFPLAEESQKYCGFTILGREYVMQRLAMGGRNSTHILARALDHILGDLKQRGLTIVVDDGLLAASSWEQLVELWEIVFARFEEFNLKMNLSKLTLISEKVVFLGRSISKDGITLDPNRTRALIEMDRFETLSDVASLLYAAQWSSHWIPGFEAIVAPIREVLNEKLKGTKRTTAACRRIKISKDFWGEKQHRAVESLKRALINAIPLDFYILGNIIIVFTDASETHWGGVILQCLRSEAHLPIEERKLRPLAWYSGSFRGSQTNWTIPEKEAFAIKQTFSKGDTMLGNPFQLHTDSNIIRFVFGNLESSHGIKETTSKKLKRWALFLTGYAFTIHHIPGHADHVDDLSATNVWADLLTQGGASDASWRELTQRFMPTSNSAVKSSAHSEEDSSAEYEPRSYRLSRRKNDQPVSPTPNGILHRFEVPRGAPIFTSRDEEESVVTVDTIVNMQRDLRASEKGRGREADKLVVRSKVIDAMGTSIQIFVRWRPQYLKTRAHKLAFEEFKKDPSGVPEQVQIVIPQQGRKRWVLVMLAHSGISAHCGVGAMKQNLKQFYWRSKLDDIKAYKHGCIHCAKARNGRLIARPGGRQVVARAPFSIVHCDFVSFPPGDDDDGDMMKYLLVIRDAMSRLTRIYPSMRCTARAAAKAIQEWIGAYGPMDVVCSDGGRHFTNELVKRSCKAIGAKQIFSVAYTPHANGAAERAVKAVVVMFRKLLLQYRVPHAKWPRLRCAVEVAINSRPSSVLGGRSPWEVAMLGKRRLPGKVLVEVGDAIAGWTTIEVATKKLRADAAAMEKIWDEIYNQDMGRVRSMSLPLFEYQAGDVVLVARRGKGVASVGEKLLGTWSGPYVITRTICSLVYEVCLLGVNPEGDKIPAGAKKEVHAERISLYSSRKLWSPVDVDELERLAQFDGRGYTVKDVKAFRRDDELRDRLEFRVRWQGFSNPADDSWEKEADVIKESALLRAAVKFATSRKTPCKWLEEFIERVGASESGSEDAVGVQEEVGVLYTPILQSE